MPKSDIPDDVKLNRGKTMEEMWQGFEAKVLPASVGPRQRFDMKSAFFSGGLCLFNWLMTAMDPEAEETEADLSRMEQMDSELNGYFKDIGLRRPK